MANHDQKTRAAFWALKAEAVNTILALHRQYEAVLAMPGQPGAQALLIRRHEVEAELDRIADAERAFLLSPSSVDALTARLKGTVAELRKAIQTMQTVQGALEGATRVVQLLRALVGLMA